MPTLTNGRWTRSIVWPVNSKALRKGGAVVALLHADASAAADIGRDVDVVYTGHSHAIKHGTTAGGAPIYEAGSFGRNMAVQDLIITGAGRRATVRVADVDLGNGHQPYGG